MWLQSPAFGDHWHAQRVGNEWRTPAKLVRRVTSAPRTYLGRATTCQPTRCPHAGQGSFWCNHYSVTSALIGWAHTQKYPCIYDKTKPHSRVHISWNTFLWLDACIHPFLSEPQSLQWQADMLLYKMIAWHENAFRITDLLFGESTDHPWIPFIKSQ